MDEATKIILKEIRKDVKEIKDMVAAQNGRLRKLENWRSALVGGWVVFIAIIGIILKIFW